MLYQGPLIGGHDAAGSTFDKHGQVDIPDQRTGLTDDRTHAPLEQSQTKKYSYLKEYRLPVNKMFSFLDLYKFSVSLCLLFIYY